MDFTYTVSKYLQSLTLRAFADWKVTGRENVPPMGPLIIVANHRSNFDPSLLSTSIPRRVVFVAKKGIFKGPLATWLLRSYGAFPLDTEGFDIRANRWAIRQLERDQAVMIFPEGTRCRGGMNRARPGVARLALMTQAPLLPVGITGTARLGTPLRVLNPTGKIKVNIGTAFSLPTIEGKPSDAVMDSLTDMIMQRIALLLPAAYRGTYRINTVQAAIADNNSLSA